MRIKIENIGKVRSADVELDGLTVIGGENNTGKSTVGKVLYSVFNSFYNKKEKMLREYSKAFGDLVGSATSIVDMHFSESEKYKSTLREFTAKLLANREKYLKDEKSLEEALSELAKNISIESKELIALKDRFTKILNISEITIVKSILRKTLNSEFNSQINNIYHGEQGSIDVKIKNKNLKFVLQDNKVIASDADLDIVTEVIYLGNPFVLDMLNDESKSKITDHSTHLASKLRSEKNTDDLIQEILIDEKLEEIENRMKEICSGDMVQKEGQFKYIDRKDSSKTLDIRSLSAGLKNFVVLKTLLEKGILSEKGILILDEPEVNLHPEWQLIFAEIIVLIHKEFNMHILINTHSPYFLEAIEVYTEKYNISKCNYYLAENISENESEIKDVTGSTELIYEKLSQPFQKLEDEDNV